MKRRKTAVPPPPPLAPHHLLKTPYEAQERAASAATQRTPNVEEYEISAELYERLSTNLQNLPDNAPPAQRLLALCGAVCGAEVELLGKEGHEDESSALETVFTSFLASLKAAAERGSVQLSTLQDAPGIALADADLRVDLEARKAGLRNRLQMLKKEEEEWHELRAKVEDLEIGGAEAEAEGEGDQGEGAEPGSSAQAIEKYAGEEIAALKALREDVHRQITMQVDGVCTLVGNIEDLIERANQTAQDAQVQHHKKRFEPFPNVHSPKVLIRKIMEAP